MPYASMSSSSTSIFQLSVIMIILMISNYDIPYAIQKYVDLFQKTEIIISLITHTNCRYCNSRGSGNSISLFRSYLYVCNINKILSDQLISEWIMGVQGLGHKFLNQFSASAARFINPEILSLIRQINRALKQPKIFLFKSFNEICCAVYRSPSGTSKNEIDFIVTDNQHIVQGVTVLNKQKLFRSFDRYLGDVLNHYTFYC